MALTLDIVPGKAVVVRREKITVAACWFGRDVRVPYVHPLVGPGSCELTRLGHPVDPVGHSHHRGIWVAHRDVGGVNFWEDTARSGRIEVTDAEVETPAGSRVAAVLECRWRGPEGPPILLEERRLEFRDLPGEELALDLTIELKSATRDEPVTLGATPFGLVGIRVADTIRVAARLGGTILNSSDGEDETGVFWQHAEWCDYSGRVPQAGPPAEAEALKAGALPARVVGVACFDHPANHPADTFWHARDDGWFGPCIGKDQPRRVPSRTPLVARYRIVAHAGRVPEAGIGERYRRWRRRG